MKLLRHMAMWLRNVVETARIEMRAIFSDPGVLIFFFLLPTAYPIVYSLIYNPEIADHTAVAIVDHSRTAPSRELARMMGSMQSMSIYGYATDMAQARHWLNDKQVYAIIEIPEDYARRLGRGEQAVVSYYCDMSLLLRYRAMLLDLSQLQMALGDKMRTEVIDRAGMAGRMALGSAKSVATSANFVGDTSQGFASFVIPGIIELIIQQSMILGICMLAGHRAERRRRSLPNAIPHGSALATLTGRVCCYLLCYLPMLIYIVTVIPWMFHYPSVGIHWHYVVYLMPMLLASAMMGVALSVFVTERESSFMVIVVLSVVFLFLSGLTWPRYAMSPFWRLMSDLVPATWGIDGFIRMASDGSALDLQRHGWHMLWWLSLGWGLAALGVTALQRRAERALR